MSTPNNRFNSNNETIDGEKKKTIRVNGKQQVLDLCASDPAFRETLLRGVEKRDPRLARELELLSRS